MKINTVASRWALVAGMVFYCELNAAQPEISGYLEPQWQGAEQGENFVQLGSSKFRLDLEGEHSEGVFLAADLVYIDYYGSLAWKMADFLPRHLVGGAPPLTIVFEDEFYLDNAYARLSGARGDITVGKQQISPGTGYAWNPTDLFNSKDVYDPTYEQRGVDGIRLDLPLGNRGNLVALYAPEEDWELSGKMLRLKQGIGHFDLSLVAVEKKWPYLFVGDAKRRLYGGDLVGELLVGCWAEYAWNEMAGAEFWELAVGLDYTLENGLYLMGEYLHRSDAPDDRRDYLLEDWLAYYSGERLSICRNQAYAYANYAWGEAWSLGLSGIFSISDGSAALVPQVMYSPRQDVELTTFGNAGLGKDGTAFSSRLGKGGMLRMRIYY